MDLHCGLLVGHDGDHYGFLCELTSSKGDADLGCFWAPWTDESPLAVFVQLPDCPYLAPDGMDACPLFGGHPGAHQFYEDST